VRKKLSDEVLAGLSLWSQTQMICIQSSWRQCHQIISWFSKIQKRFYFPGASLPRLSRKGGS